jgi:hypothetical protein
MKTSMQQFIARVRREARPRATHVSLTAMGRTRVFLGYDWGGDTFIFEKDVWKSQDEHLPILIVQKRDLVRGSSGFIFTLTTGNHTVATVPLLSGQFWNLGRVAPSQRSPLLQNSVVCANVVRGLIEISQRDVPTKLVTQADEWLMGLGFALHEVIMTERNDVTLELYRRQGQEWRIKPLAWTRREMELAIAASRTRINTSLRYYHSAKGVHFLSYAEFHKLLALVEGDCTRFVACLRELVSIFEGDKVSWMRAPKFHGHHEVELFGLRRGEALQRLVPELEKLMEGITLKRLTPAEIGMRLQCMDTLFKASLERPELADEGADDFVETLYLHLTGAIYTGHGETVTPAFDDRRTALPGATFRGGRPEFHPGADERTRILLANVEQMMSQDEAIEYVNIYEVRSREGGVLGSGVTREIVFKTNRRPLCTSLIEKRLKLTKSGYGSYMLVRVHAFKALGVNFGEYRLLMRLDSRVGHEMNYFIRNRCPGEPLDDIPARMFYRVGDSAGGETQDDPDVVLALGALLGNAAAQNLALKKYLLETESCRFGEGKEVFEFGYDIASKREMPLRVMLCSMRGSLGWTDVSYTEENLGRLFGFYFTRYADVLYRFWQKHRKAVTLDELANRFFDGFELKTREMNWNYSVRREQFDDFTPRLHTNYGFRKKWLFALWSFERQVRRLPQLRLLFIDKVRSAHAKEEPGGAAKP